MTACNAPRRMSGFSLIELLIALAILTMMAVMVGAQFNGAKAKGQVLVTSLSTMGSAMNQLKLHTGCHVRKLVFLMEQPTNAQNTTDDNYCAADMSGTWSGPYVERFATVDDSRAMSLPKLGSGVAVYVTDTSNDDPGVSVGNRVVYYLEARNVPMDIIKEALAECNSAGIKAFNEDFRNGRCAIRDQATRDAINGSAASGQTGEFAVMFDETR